MPISIHKQPFLAKVGAVLAIAIAICGVGIFILFMMSSRDVPDFFPLNHPQGTYTVTLGCPSGQGLYEKEFGHGDQYCIEYRGPGIFVGVNENGKNTFFRITVGRSKVDLRSFLDKSVRISKGDFASRSEQCIQSVCANIGGPFIVLDIDELRLLSP